MTLPLDGIENPQPEVVDLSRATTEVVDAPVIASEDIPGRDPSDANNGAYHKSSHEYINLTWQLGWTDGRYGQPSNTNEDVLATQGELEWLSRIENIKTKIGDAQARAATLQAAVDRTKPKLDALVVYFDELKDRRSKSFQDFSRPSAWTYAIFAGVLLFSDIPLSMKLVAGGFNLDFWGGLLLALGIASTGVFVKYFLDEFFFRKSADAPHPLFRVTLIGVLVLFAATIIVLGFYRSDRQARDVRQDTRTKISNQVKKEEDDAIENGLRSRTPEAIATDITKRYEEVNESKVGQFTFIFLTLLLPIIGAICFSTSGRKFRHAKQFDITRNDLEETTKEYEGYLKALNLAKEDFDSQTTKLQYYEQTSLIKESIMNVQKSLYLHGYERGRNVCETLQHGVSLYTRCQSIVEKLLAKKLQGKLWVN